MLKFLVLVLLVAVVIEAKVAPVQPTIPSYCYDQECPSGTTKCKKNEVAENARKIHVQVQCLDQAGTILRKHIDHVQNSKADALYHTETTAAPKNCKGAGCH